MKCLEVRWQATAPSREESCIPAGVLKALRQDKEITEHDLWLVKLHRKLGVGIQAKLNHQVMVWCRNCGAYSAVKLQNLADSTCPLKIANREAWATLNNRAKFNLSRIGSGNHPVYNDLLLEVRTAIKVVRSHDIINRVRQRQGAGNRSAELPHEEVGETEETKSGAGNERSESMSLDFGKYTSVICAGLRDLKNPHERGV